MKEFPKALYSTDPAAGKQAGGPYSALYRVTVNSAKEEAAADALPLADALGALSEAKKETKAEAKADTKENALRAEAKELGVSLAGVRKVETIEAKIEEAKAEAG